MEPHYIGVDLHRAFFQACAVMASGDRQWERRFPRTTEGLAMFREHCSAATHIAVEASGPTWAFVDAVAASGAQVSVVVAPGYA